MYLQKGKENLNVLSTKAKDSHGDHEKTREQVELKRKELSSMFSAKTNLERDKADGLKNMEQATNELGKLVSPVSAFDSSFY